MPHEHLIDARAVIKDRVPDAWPFRALDRVDLHVVAASGAGRRWA